MLKESTRQGFNDRISVQWAFLQSREMSQIWCDTKLARGQLSCPREAIKKVQQVQPQYEAYEGLNVLDDASELEKVVVILKVNERHTDT